MTVNIRGVEAPAAAQIAAQTGLERVAFIAQAAGWAGQVVGHFYEAECGCGAVAAHESRDRVEPERQHGRIPQRRKQRRVEKGVVGEDRRDHEVGARTHLRSVARPQRLDRKRHAIAEIIAQMPERPRRSAASNKRPIGRERQTRSAYLGGRPREHTRIEWHHTALSVKLLTRDQPRPGDDPPAGRDQPAGRIVGEHVGIGRSARRGSGQQPHRQDVARPERPIGQRERSTVGIFQVETGVRPATCKFHSACQRGLARGRITAARYAALQPRGQTGERGVEHIVDDAGDRVRTINR